MAERSAYGPSTQALIDEAISRDIPFIRLDRHSLVQLGQGVHQQRIRATMTSRTSAIGVDIASDKSLTNRLLDSAGLPVPRAEVVETEDGASAAAHRLGYPCVVKPLDGNHGRGVHLDLRTDEAVRAAYHGAVAQSRAGDVVVETYVTGRDYRCLVIGGKVAAIAERVPASVTGDGEHTIRSWSTSPTSTRAGGSVTRRSSPGSGSTGRPRSSSGPRAGSQTRSHRPRPGSSSP